MEIYSIKSVYVFQKECILPVYKSMMFRGVFGNIYRDMVCLNRQEKECPRCRYKQSCNFAINFHGLNFTNEKLDTKYLKFTNFPPKFVFFIPENKTSFSFGDTMDVYITFAGKPVIDVEILYLILKKVEENQFDFNVKNEVLLSRITDLSNNEDIYYSNRILRNSINRIHIEMKPRKFPVMMTIKFHTPCRITNNGLLISNEIDGTILGRRMIERLKLLTLGNEIPYQPKWIPEDISILSKKIKWIDVKHRSNRQKKTITMGGFIGTLNLLIPSTEALADTQLLQYLHVGTNTQGGYGKFSITELKEIAI